MFVLQTRQKGQCCFVLILLPCSHAFISKKILDRRLNCNISYCVNRLSFAYVKSQLRLRESWPCLSFACVKCSRDCVNRDTSLSFARVKCSWHCVSRDRGLSHACVAGSWRAVRSHATLCWSHNAWLVKREKQRRRSCRGNVQKRHHYTVPELFGRRSILDHPYKVRALARDELGRVASKWGANAFCLDFMLKIASWRKLHKSEARIPLSQFYASAVRQSELKLETKCEVWGYDLNGAIFLPSAYKILLQTEEDRLTVVVNQGLLTLSDVRTRRVIVSMFVWTAIGKNCTTFIGPYST